MKISKNEKQLINDAIKQAETNTSGEILPVILSKSDNYPAAKFRLALIMSSILTLSSFYFIVEIDALIIIWAHIFGMFIGILISFIPVIKRLVITKNEIEEEVYQRAIEIFHENKISMTKERTGILIFISLFEKKVIILGDCGINEKVSPNYWDEIIFELVQNIKNHKLIEGLINTINTCSKSLSLNFPRSNFDENEITDELLTDLLEN